MKKHKLKMSLFTVLLVVTMMFTSIVPGYAQEKEGDLSTEAMLSNATSVDRINGESRYHTAIEVSKHGWDSADTVVLARGDDFADALTSVPLAYKLGGPILLTQPNKLLADTMKEMKRLGVKKVVIVGGELAINSTVEESISKEGIEVTRVSGENRFETAVLIADMVDSNKDSAVIVNGYNFPDALSVAPYVARGGIPILLTKTNEVPSVTKEKLQKYDGPYITVIGGPSVISDKAWFQIPGFKQRFGGQNRYSTNIILNELNGVENSHMFVATGENYADALTGAVLAAKHNSGLLLVKENNVPEVVSGYVQRMGLTKLTIFGGELAVSQKVSKELEKLLQ